MSKFDKLSVKKNSRKITNRLLDMKFKELELAINLSNISPNTHSHLIQTIQDIKFSFLNSAKKNKLRVNPTKV